MKFYQLMKYNKKNIFIKDHAENEAGRLVTGFVLFFKKDLCKIKASGLQLGFTIFPYPSNQHIIKTNCIKL